MMDAYFTPRLVSRSTSIQQFLKAELIKVNGNVY